MKSTIINSKDLLDPQNNPTGRLDPGFGIALSKMLNKEPITDPHKTLQDICKDQRWFDTLTRTIRKQTHLQAVKDLIAVALLNRKVCTDAAEFSQKANFSPAVREGIHQLATDLCKQEAKLSNKKSRPSSKKSKTSKPQSQTTTKSDSSEVRQPKP